MAPLEKCRRTIALGGGESTFRLCWRNGVQDPRIGAGRGSYSPARRAAAGAGGAARSVAVGDRFARARRPRPLRHGTPRAHGRDRPVGGYAHRLAAHQSLRDLAAMARALCAGGHAQYGARVRLPGRQRDRRHPRSGRAYRAALAALAGGDGQGVFAHKSRRDPAIAATGSRAYWPGMTAPHQEASKLGQFSWALFDWANQPFFTVVTTFIFAPYFANVMVGNAIEGQAAWAFTQSTSGILIALMSPFLGAMADAGGPRKPYMLTFQLLLGVGCAALWWAYPGRPDLIGPISAAVVIATIGAEMSIVFNNAQLPHIV